MTGHWTERASNDRCTSQTGRLMLTGESSGRTAASNRDELNVSTRRGHWSCRIRHPRADAQCASRRAL